MTTASSRNPLHSLPAHSKVVIAGGGPSGLFLGLDLARYGIPSIILEPRVSIDPHRPRAKTTNARTMTHLRRLGLARKLRLAAPLPVEYSQDVIFCSSLAGYEVARFSNAFQLAAGRYEPQPESGQQVPQPVLESMLREAVELEPLTDLHTELAVTGLDVGIDTDSRGNSLHRVYVADDRGNTRTLLADYVVGADGGSSAVRKALGINLEGSSAARSNLSVLFRSHRLAEKITLDPAVQYWVMNPQAPGMIGPADLHGTWWAILQGVDVSGADLHPEASIRAMAGLDIDVEIIAEDPWTARMLLAERYGQGSVFLIGDAAHLNPPWGGHGFNTCIGDAANLAWKLAAALKGWGGPALLDSYEQERRPVAARTIRDAASNGKALANDFSDEALGDAGPVGEKARAVAAAALQVKRSEFDSLGLVLGYTYAQSPTVTSDGVAPPREDPILYFPSAVPGCLLPHAWLSDSTSLYDELTDGFTLLVDAGTLGGKNVQERFAPLATFAAENGVPLTVRAVSAAGQERPLAEAWEASAVLVRPDQHVAWRGSDASLAVAALNKATGWQSDRSSSPADTAESKVKANV